MATYLKFTNKFTDGETRNIQIGEFDTSASSILPTNLKPKIKDFNDPTKRATISSAFDNAFVSSNGAPFEEISAAEIITTQRTYFNV